MAICKRWINSYIEGLSDKQKEIVERQKKSHRRGMGERLMDIAEPMQVANQKQYNVNSWHVLASTSQFLPTRVLVANHCFFL